MSGNSVVLLLILIGIFLWSIAELAQSLLETLWLRSGIRTLTETPSSREAFPRNTGLQKRAAAAVRKAQEAKTLAQFHPERDLTAITNEFSARLGRTRALAGLLIITGLLVTLMNLRVAVEDMKQTIRTSPTAAAAPSANSPSEGADAAIGNGIEGIASAAAKAFRYSGIAIGLAGVVLFFSVVAQRLASSAVREFSSWLFERHDVLIVREAEEPQDTPDKLAYAASMLVEVSKTFRETNSALSDLKLFGSKLETAAQEISAAVAELPSRLDDSMAKISGDVTVGIRDGLEHQSQYLSSLVAIYSEHGILVQKTVEFISRIAEANKSASEALASLGTLPNAVESVARSSEQSRAASQELATAVLSLEQKVEALPSADLARAADQLSIASGRLITLESNVSTIMETVKSHFETAINEATRRSGETMMKHLENLDLLIKSMKADVNGSTATTIEIKEALSQLKATVDKLSTTADPGLEPLRNQIERLTQNIASLPSLQIRRMFGSGK